MDLTWIYPFIVIGGVLQAPGAPMNAQLKSSLQNTWLASAIAFSLVSMMCLQRAKPPRRD